MPCERIVLVDREHATKQAHHLAQGVGAVNAALARDGDWRRPKLEPNGGALIARTTIGVPRMSAHCPDQPARLPRTEGASVHLHAILL